MNCIILLVFHIIVLTPIFRFIHIIYQDRRTTTAMLHGKEKTILTLMELLKENKGMVVEKGDIIIHNLDQRISQEQKTGYELKNVTSTIVRNGDIIINNLN